MNESSPRKRLWPTVSLILVTAAALAVCLLFAGYLVLPKLVTDRLPVAQIQRLGFADFTGRITRIGLYQTAAGPFVFGLADQPTLRIDSILLDYTPGTLLRKKIGCIRFSGVTVNATLGPDGFALAGMDSGNASWRVPVDDIPSDTSSRRGDMAVERIEIRSGMANLTWGKAIYKIPFEADLKADGRGMMNLDARVRLFLRDQLFTVAAQVDVNHRKARVRLDGAAIVLDRFADLIHLIPGVDATGSLSLQTRATVTLAPFTLSDAAIDLTWHIGRLAVASVAVEPESDEVPARLSAVSGNLETWQIEAGGVQLRSPVPVTMTRLAATVNLGGAMRTASGKTELTVLPGSIEGPTPVSITARVSLPLAFEATQQVSGEWTAGFSTPANHPPTPPDSLDLTLVEANIHGGAPRFSLTATGDGQGGAADWQLDMNALLATVAGAILDLPSVDARGQLQFTREPHGPVWVGDARVQLSTPTLEGNGMVGSLDALTLFAEFTRRAGDAPGVDAWLQVSNGRFHHRASGLRLSGGRLYLPFRTGVTATGSQGTFSVARVAHNKRVLGNIQGRITQVKDAYAFTAVHDSDLFAGMTATFAGRMSTTGPRSGDADITFEIPPYELPAESDLGRFTEAARGVTLSGTVSAQGSASISSSGINGDVDVAMTDGVLRIAEKKIEVTGIDTTLRFPELPRIRSGPAQQIRFARAAMGGLIVEGGIFDVQVESANTLFVEKGRLRWCGGKVDAQALRMTAGRQDYQVNLYCQRLELSRLLEQLGSVNARGTGTVNGRIPISYSNGSIRFDDGFLFSTPGEGGRIQLSGTEVLTRGIPAGTPQFAQVELAQAALEDYDYTWAKLGLVSEGDDFVMRLQFDGKPANPLPFVYKKEIGSFVRVRVGAQGSVFQGIGLDVNLRLPLNQLLQYKDILNMIE